MLEVVVNFVSCTHYSKDRVAFPVYSRLCGVCHRPSPSPSPVPFRADALCALRCSQGDRLGARQSPCPGWPWAPRTQPASHSPALATVERPLPAPGGSHSGPARRMGGRTHPPTPTPTPERQGVSSRWLPLVSLSLSLPLSPLPFLSLSVVVRLFCPKRTHKAEPGQPKTDLLSEFLFLKAIGGKNVQWKVLFLRFAFYA